MRYFTSALCAVAAFSVAVFAQENPIIKPDNTEPVVAGSPYLIRWKPTTEGTVTLTLRQGESTDLDDVYVIADGTPNSGTYEWTPKSSLPAGKDYAIMITSAKGDKNYTPLIEIQSDAEPSEKEDEEEDKDEKPKATSEDAEPSKTAAPSGRITPISNSTKFSNSTKTTTKARKPTTLPTTAEPEPSATESAEPSGSAAPDSGAMAVVRSPIALIACLAAGLFFLN